MAGLQKPGKMNSLFAAFTAVGLTATTTSAGFMAAEMYSSTEHKLVISDDGHVALPVVPSTDATVSNITTTPITLQDPLDFKLDDNLMLSNLPRDGFFARGGGLLPPGMVVVDQVVTSDSFEDSFKVFIPAPQELAKQGIETIDIELIDPVLGSEVLDSDRLTRALYTYRLGKFPEQFVTLSDKNGVAATAYIDEVSTDGSQLNLSATFDGASGAFSDQSLQITIQIDRDAEDIFAPNHVGIYPEAVENVEIDINNGNKSETEFGIITIRNTDPYFRSGGGGGGAGFGSPIVYDHYYILPIVYGGGGGGISSDGGGRRPDDKPIPAPGAIALLGLGAFSACRRGPR